MAKKLLVDLAEARACLAIRSVGWVTGFGHRLGGSLCCVLNWREHKGGAFDVEFQSVARFTVVEKWEERVPDMPRAPRLTVVGNKRKAPAPTPPHFSLV